jgi:sec-independent protein translocase protein TatA
MFLLGMFGIGPTEMAIVVILLILLFGPSQIPKLFRSFGQTIRESRNAMNELTEAEDELKAGTRDINKELRS